MIYTKLIMGIASLLLINGLTANALIMRHYSANTALILKTSPNQTVENIYIESPTDNTVIYEETITPDITQDTPSNPQDTLDGPITNQDTPNDNSDVIIEDIPTTEENSTNEPVIEEALPIPEETTIPDPVVNMETQPPVNEMVEAEPVIETTMAPELEVTDTTIEPTMDPIQ